VFRGLLLGLSLRPPEPVEGRRAWFAIEIAASSEMGLFGMFTHQSHNVSQLFEDAFSIKVMHSPPERDPPSARNSDSEFFSEFLRILIGCLQLFHSDWNVHVLPSATDLGELTS
jgi:hypothetical protein